MAHNRGAKDFGPCWQRTASAFECILRGATGDGWWSAGGWFQTAGKASMIPHDDEEEKGSNRHLIYMYIFMHNANLSCNDDTCALGYLLAIGMVTAWTNFIVNLL